MIERVRLKDLQETEDRAGSVEMETLFGPAPIISGEDRTAYDTMMRRAREAVGPRDFIEEILLDDIVRTTWVTARYRRLNNALLASGFEKNKRVPIDEIMAHALTANLPDIMQIDSLTASAEAGRTSALRELDRRRYAAAVLAR